MKTINVKLGFIMCYSFEGDDEKMCVGHWVRISDIEAISHVRDDLTLITTHNKTYRIDDNAFDVLLAIGE